MLHKIANIYVVVLLLVVAVIAVRIYVIEKIAGDLQKEGFQVPAIDYISGNVEIYKP